MAATASFLLSRTFGQGEGVLALGEGLRLGQRLFEIRLQVRSQLFVIPRGRGIAGQEEFVGKIVAVFEPDRAEIQHGRDEHDAIQTHAQS